MTLEEFRNIYSKKTYLGDGLYARFDGYHIVLSTLPEGMKHYIPLESCVFDALIIYRKKICEGMEKIEK